MKIATENNVDAKVARGFGDEWSKFRQDQTNLAQGERETIFENYFRIFPWDLLPPGGGTGADIGCGTGRWAKIVAPRVAHLHLLDASPDATPEARAGAEWGLSQIRQRVATRGARLTPQEVAHRAALERDIVRMLERRQSPVPPPVSQPQPRRPWPSAQYWEDE